MRTRSIVCAVLILAFGAIASFAQSTFGTIVGTIKDSTGALMPGVVVTVVNIGTSLSRSTMADESASYSFVNLEPGTYKVTMMAPGFQLAQGTRPDDGLSLIKCPSITSQACSAAMNVLKGEPSTLTAGLF